MKYRATNIQWYIDDEELLDVADSLSTKEITKILDIPAKTYNGMTTKERHDYIEDACRHCLATRYEIMGLPDDAEIPDNIIEIVLREHDEEAITTWLSCEYGTYVDGYDLPEELERMIAA